MQARLSHEQMVTLRCGPLWVVSAVLGRVNGFNPTELDAVWNSVIDTANGSRGLTRDILGELAADRSGALRQLETSPWPVATALLRIVGILDEIDADAAVEVKHAFLAVGRGVARVRSLGRTISDDDAKALLLVATLLGLSLDATGPAPPNAPAWSDDRLRRA